MKTKTDGVKLNGFNKMKLLHCDLFDEYVSSQKNVKRDIIEKKERLLSSTVKLCWLKDTVS